MIVMELKSSEEILEMLSGKKKIVLFGDSGCAQMCDVGGIIQLEDMEDFLTEHGKEVLGYIFVEGGICDQNAIQQEIDANRQMLEEADAFLIQACGVATQTLTMLMPDKESFPAVNSNFLGLLRERHEHEELCSMCGDCILHLTGGICPVTRCPKGILNGPCGGSLDGMCERDDETECAWQLIYDRLKKLGKLENIRKIWEVKNWSLSQGPRKISQKTKSQEVAE